MKHSHFVTGLCAGILFVFSLPSYADLLASVLPGARTVQVGATSTAFATIVNTGSSTATQCSIAPATVVDATFLYQTTDPATNALTGTADTPVDIAAGASQTFVFAFTPGSAFAQTSITLTFDCTNTSPAPTGVVNTFSLGASTTPVPDIIALAATAPNDGIVRLGSDNPDTGAFSVASVNIGAAGTIMANGSNSAGLPLSTAVCETNPGNGLCINPGTPAASTTRDYSTNETATYSFFVTPSDTIALDPANSRVFANFKGIGNSAEGVTSVAVEGGAPLQGENLLNWDQDNWDGAIWK